MKTLAYRYRLTSRPPRRESSWVLHRNWKQGHPGYKTEKWSKFLVVLCGIIGVQIHTVTGFTSINPVFPCQNHSTTAAYSFTHPSPELCSLSGRNIVKQQKARIRLTDRPVCDAHRSHLLNHHNIYYNCMITGTIIISKTLIFTLILCVVLLS